MISIRIQLAAIALLSAAGPARAQDSGPLIDLLVRKGLITLREAEEEDTMGDSINDLRALQGVSKFPVRIKCALLGFDALQEALKREAAGEAH